MFEKREMVSLFLLMNSDELNFPDPDELVREAGAMPPKVPLRDYFEALSAMRDKGYSYAEIAQWISEKLGVEISRNRVAYVLNTPPEVQDAEEHAEDMEDQADEAEENR